MNNENDSPKSNPASTPPAISRVRNPFDKVLIESLHKPICSPGMCKIYKKKSNGLFRWDIDQQCVLVPADIVPCNSQFEPSPDPVMEKIAEEATERFFSQEVVIPSPAIQSSKKITLLESSHESSLQTSFAKKLTRNVSAQTVLTFPSTLPQEFEKMLETYFTYKEDQSAGGEYEIAPNDTLRRKLRFEENSDTEHYDSEQTDDELHVETTPPTNYDHHKPVLFSPDLCKDFAAKGVKRTFGTPLKKAAISKFRNKILDSVDIAEPCISPIMFHTPKKIGWGPNTPSPLALASISPVTKAFSSDEEKHNSPECATSSSCVDCVSTQEADPERPCLCKNTPEKYMLKRSMSLKDTPERNRKGSLSFSERRSLSMSSLHRSRSVQKLDFSMDMSVDASFDRSQDLENNYLETRARASWSMSEEASIQQLVAAESYRSSSSHESPTKSISHDIDETPVKGKSKLTILSHKISTFRTPKVTSPLHMSLDSSLLDTDNLNMEHKKVDFNNLDLKFFDSQYKNSTKADASSSFKRADSGFNEMTTFTNASSYYESAIKPSELTITNKTESVTALKEISNVAWARVDSGFKDENSVDSIPFYQSETVKKASAYRFSGVKYEDKENAISEDYERFLTHGNKNEATMSMSDIFTDDMTFNCNFSSTPSKNKSRKNL